MAKIGEGDSRWIVTDREDGANCNNWHWTEKDISAWAFDEIKKAVENKDIHKDGQFSLTTKKVTDISGDCTVMNRKKKLICAFDISFDVEWEGKALERETGEVLWTDTGKFKVPDCDDTTVGDELQVNCTYKEVTGSFTEDIVKFARTHGVPFLRGVMMEFQKKLKDTHQITNKLPSQVSESKSPQSRGPTEVEVTQTGSIKWHIQWRCPPSEIFDALVNQGKVNAYTRCQSTVQTQEGGKYEVLGGSIKGRFTNVKKDELIEMDWRLDNWESGHYSKVKLVFECDEAGTTEMKFLQTDIPSTDVDRVKQGWTRNFWEPIKVVFGFIFNIMDK